MGHYSWTKEPNGRGNWVSKEGTRNGKKERKEGGGCEKGGGGGRERWVEKRRRREGKEERVKKIKGETEGVKE